LLRFDHDRRKSEADNKKDREPDSPYRHLVVK
jgi:hypothetical protein